MSFFFSSKSKSNSTDSDRSVETVVATAVPIAEAVVEPVVVSTAQPLQDDLDVKKDQCNEKEYHRELDLCFVMDCTGSMGQYINEAKQTIQSISNRLIQEKLNVRFGLIAYRDHPPQDETYVTKVFRFTESINNVQSSLNQLSAAGGGDGPEALTSGLFQALNLNWRPNSTKVCILIADAPPHGIGESGDGFPNGDPDGHDPLEIAREMAKRGITIYPVACEPALSTYKFAKGFMVALAEITAGVASVLASSKLLSDVILGGTIEEVGLQELTRQFQTEMAEMQRDYAERGIEADIDKLSSDLHERMKVKKVQVQTWNCDGKLSDEKSAVFSAYENLSQARESATFKSYAATSDVSNSAGRKKKIASLYGRSAYGGSRVGAPPSEEESSGPVDGWSSYEFLSKPAPSETSSNSATISAVVTEDVSWEQCRRIVSKAKQQQKI